MSESTKELRELNTAVAEKVLHLAACDSWRSINFGRGGGAAMINENCEHNGQCFPAKTGPAHYSESIEAAMQVVEKMRGCGIWTQIQTFTHTTQVRVEMGVPSSECQEWGATMEEAICKCALKAVTKFELLVDKAAALAALEQKS